MKAAEQTVALGSLADLTARYCCIRHTRPQQRRRRQTSSTKYYEGTSGSYRCALAVRNFVLTLVVSSCSVYTPDGVSNLGFGRQLFPSLL